MLPVERACSNGFGWSLCPAGVARRTLGRTLRGRDAAFPAFQPKNEGKRFAFRPSVKGILPASKVVPPLSRRFVGLECTCLSGFTAELSPSVSFAA